MITKANIFDHLTATTSYITTSHIPHTKLMNIAPLVCCIAVHDHTHFFLKISPDVFC